MEKTKIMVSEKKIEALDGDLLVFCLPEKEKEEKRIPCHGLIDKTVNKAVACGDFSGKFKETFLFYPDASDEDDGLSAKRVLVVGMGKPPCYDGSSPDKKRSEEAIQSALREGFREIGGAIAHTCASVKAESVMIVFPEVDKAVEADVAECIVEGVSLGDYRFLKYKTKPGEENGDALSYKGLSEVRCHPAGGCSIATIRKAVNRGKLAAAAACRARDMANEPGNGWKASDFAAFGKEIADRYGMTCTFFDKARLEKMEMGGILAVNRGSKEPPGMVIVAYRPEKKGQTLLLVGKGITFDSGGISIKPGAGMHEMKYDMCGGAAVLAAMQVVGEEKPDVGVVAIVPATDNLSGSDAIKPGDIIRHYGGTTSEIINTDAEGRLILADALAYGIETYQPDCVVNIATLTGAVITGLGHHYAGVMSNHDVLVTHLTAAGQRAGEPLWRLPLGKPYRKQIESKVADIKNTGGKSAGVITAGAYLEHFVGDTPWAHIDIAGTAWDFTEKNYIPKGPSGFGVRTFVELIRHWKKGHLD